MINYILISVINIAHEHQLQKNQNLTSRSDIPLIEAPSHLEMVLQNCDNSIFPCLKRVRQDKTITWNIQICWYGQTENLTSILVLSLYL